MADKEIKIKLSFDLSKFEENLKKIDKSMKVLESQTKLSASSLESFGRSTDALKLKAESLSSKIELQKQKVQILNEEYKKSVEEKGKDREATQKLEIKLNGATTTLNKMQKELKTLNQEIRNQPTVLTKFSSSLDTLNGKIEGFGKGVTSLGNKVTAGLTTPIIALVVSTIKFASDFESAFAGVEKTVDATTEQLDSIKQGIRNMAKEIPSTREEIAKVAEVARTTWNTN